MSTHKAIIAKISISKHPNADKLAVGLVCNETVVCGINIPNDTLGIYFPCELQLSKEFAEANDLIRRKNPDGTPAGGMFDENRRVRIQKIRGVKSNGFWISLESLKKLGGDISKLKEGDMIDTWNGKPLCNKYVPKGIRVSNKSQKTKSSEKQYTYVFPEHKDTEQFKYFVKNFNKGDELIITAKLHGSSQRVARNYEIRPLKWWEKIINIFAPIDRRVMTTLNGTRRVVLNNKDRRAGYHPEKLREDAASKISPYLETHMQVFFEVVGYEDNNSSIMPSHNTNKIQDKEVKKLYGEKITYTYGCPVGQFDIYVYRIAYVLPNGHTIDLLWDDVVKWCNEWKIKHVPELKRFIFDGNHRDLIDLIESMSDGPDPIDPRHPMEGVCIRVNSNKWQCYKNKGWTFKILEGIAKEDDNYSDKEEEQVSET